MKFGKQISSGFSENISIESLYIKQRSVFEIIIDHFIHENELMQILNGAASNCIPSFYFFPCIHNISSSCYIYTRQI